MYKGIQLYDSTALYMYGAVHGRYGDLEMLNLFSPTSGTLNKSLHYNGGHSTFPKEISEGKRRRAIEPIAFISLLLHVHLICFLLEGADLKTNACILIFKPIRSLYVL